MSKDEDFELVEGTGNVFRDLGDPDHALKQTKALLAADIVSALDNAGLSVRRAAEATGFAAADFSRIRNANLGRFTVDRMVRILSALDQVSKAATRNRESGVLSELGKRHAGPKLTDTSRGDTQSTPSLDSFDAVALAKRYERNPALRALVKLIPYGPAVEAAALAAVGRIREDRARTFFDELATANAIDNPELLESEDFIHRFLTTMRFALNTRRREKIQMFARLFGGSLPEGELSDVDEYEDFLVILDELSYREIRALAILSTFAVAPRTREQSDMEWTLTFWDAFCERLSSELPLPAKEVPDYMKRISRTGCFQELVGYYDARPGVGKLTPTYLRLAAYVRAVG